MMGTLQLSPNDPPDQNMVNTGAGSVTKNGTFVTSVVSIRNNANHADTTQFADNPSAIPTFGIRINKLLQDIPIIELSEIAVDQKPEPVWTINQPVIRLDLKS